MSSPIDPFPSARVRWLVDRAVVAQARAHALACRLADEGRLHVGSCRAPSSDPMISALQEQLAAREEDLTAAWREVERLGGLIRDRRTGMVDFPWSDGAGRQVYLCWRQGDEQPTHWHARSEDCTERRPLGD